jgi:membrane protease YdiL (CAAX protease family)
MMVECESGCPGDPSRRPEDELAVQAASAPSEVPWAIPLAQPVEAPRTGPGGFDLLIGVGCAWGMEVASAGALAVIVALQGRSSNEFAFEGLPPLGIIISATTSAVFAALVSWYFVCCRQGRSVRDGLALKKIGTPALLACFGLAVAGAILPILATLAGGTGRSPLARLIDTREGLMAFGALALLLPQLEEVYYRGFIFPILRKHLGASWAIVLVTLWFGGAHAFQLAGDWPTLALVTCMGALWTIQRHVTDSLVPSMITHWVYNLLVILPAVLMKFGAG